MRKVRLDAPLLLACLLGILRNGSHHEEKG